MNATTSGQDWCDCLHTAEDIASARAALTTWTEHAGNADTAASMAGDITKRAIELGLEAAHVQA